MSKIHGAIAKIKYDVVPSSKIIRLTILFASRGVLCGTMRYEKSHRCVAILSYRIVHEQHVVTYRVFSTTKSWARFHLTLCATSSYICSLPYGPKNVSSFMSIIDENVTNDDTQFAGKASEYIERWQICSRLNAHLKCYCANGFFFVFFLAEYRTEE